MKYLADIKPKKKIHFPPIVKHTASLQGKMQQFYPDAHIPAFIPPLLLHSGDVMQVPLRKAVPKELSERNDILL